MRCQTCGSKEGRSVEQAIFCPRCEAWYEYRAQIIRELYEEWTQNEEAKR